MNQSSAYATQIYASLLSKPGLLEDRMQYGVQDLRNAYAMRQGPAVALYALLHQYDAPPYCATEQPGKPGAMQQAVNARARLAVPLAMGEIDVLRRALRTYICAEQQAIQSAACARDPAHAVDVRRQVQPRIDAAGDLLDRLLKVQTGRA